MSEDLDTTDEENEISDEEIASAFKKLGVTLSKKKLEAGETLMKSNLSKVAAPLVLQTLIKELRSLEFFDDVLVSAVNNVDIQELQAMAEYEDMEMDEIRIQTHGELIRSKATISSAKAKVIDQLAKFINYEPPTGGGKMPIKRGPPVFGVQVNVSKGGETTVKEAENG